MKKKLLTLGMAATMAVSTVISAFAAETLTGTAWWTGMQTGKDYAVENNGSTTLTIETDADTAAFSVELYTTGYFFTTGSDGNGWLAEGLKDGSVTCPFAENGGADPGKFVAGHTYEVTVTRADKNLEMVYYDATDKAEIYKITATCVVDVPAEMNVHVMAQVGTVTVDVKADNADKAEEATTKAPAKDDSKDDTKATTTKAADEDEEGMSPVVIVVVAVVAVVVIAGIVVATKKKN